MSKLQELEKQLEEERQKVQKKEVFIEIYTNLLNDFINTKDPQNWDSLTQEVIKTVTEELTFFVETKIEGIITGKETEKQNTESFTEEEVSFLKKLVDRGKLANNKPPVTPKLNNPENDLFRQQHAHRVNTDITFIDSNKQYVGRVVGISNNQLLVRVNNSPTPMKVNPIQIQDAY